MNALTLARAPARGGHRTSFLVSRWSRPQRGDPEKLGRLSRAPELQRLTMRASACLSGVGVVNAVVDAGVARWMGAWKVAIADIV